MFIFHGVVGAEWEVRKETHIYFSSRTQISSCAAHQIVTVTLPHRFAKFMKTWPFPYRKMHIHNFPQKTTSFFYTVACEIQHNTPMDASWGTISQTHDLYILEFHLNKGLARVVSHLALKDPKSELYPIRTSDFCAWGGYWAEE